MKLLNVVLKDIMRRKRRVLYATVGVIIGTMTVISILTVARAGEARIYGQLEKYGANLNILPATESLSSALGDLTLGTVTIGENHIPEEKVQEIQQISDSEIKTALNIKDEGRVAVVAPKLYVQGDIKGTSIMLVGILPEEEFTIRTWWEIKEGRKPGNSREVTAGSMAARLLPLKNGETIVINGTSFTVSGILGDTGSNDDYQIFLPLAVLQEIYNKPGLVSTIDVRALCNGCPVEVIANAINTEITGVRAVAVKQVADTEMGVVEKVNRLMLALAGITLLVGGFGVVNTLMTSINERTRDFGIMRAVGASRRQIMLALVYEAVIIGIAGGIMGFGFGTLLAYTTGPLIFEGARIALVPVFIPVSLGLAILIAVTATLYPAFRAGRIRVADSFRSL